MHNRELRLDVLRVSLVRVIPNYEWLTWPRNIYEEDEDPRVLENYIVGTSSGWRRMLSLKSAPQIEHSL